LTGVESRAAELFQLYGLSQREAMVYLFVLKMGAASAGEIAKALQLRRMEGYRLVRKLADSGVILANAGKPVTYSAQPIDDVVSAMLEEEGRRMKKMELAKQELLALSQALPRGQTRPSEQQFRIIQGREQIYNRIAKMAETSHNSLDLLLTKNDLVQAYGLGLTDKLNDAARHSVKVRVISFIDESTMDSAEHINAKCDVRHSSESQRSRMVLSDRSSALSSLVLDDTQGRRNERDVAIYSESPNYAEMMSSLFEVAYKAASDSKERIEGLREGRLLEGRVKALADVLQAMLPEEGMKVKTPGLLIGRSGASYDFVAVVGNDQKTFGIDVVAAKKPQDARERVVQSMMKRLELPQVGIIVVSTVEVGEEVEGLAKLMGVTLIEAKDTISAVSELRKALKA
jgi:sugar-specific transcriptional regulator TrmB